jgi:mRNA-degrading endonuclease RelE of RelBE toxin-antitoxin system
VTCSVFLSEHAQRDLDTFSDKVIKQIHAHSARLANDPIPDGTRIKKLQGW